MVYQWSLSDNKSTQVSRTLLSILTDLGNTAVWMVSTRPLISKSFTPCINPLLTVLRAPIRIGIIFTLMFHNYFYPLAMSRNLSLFSHSFNFTLWSTGTALLLLLWTPAYGQSKAGQPARIYIQQLCDDTGCNPEDRLEVMNDRETWRERVRDIRASRTT